MYIYQSEMITDKFLKFAKHTVSLLAAKAGIHPVMVKLFQDKFDFKAPSFSFCLISTERDLNNAIKALESNEKQFDKKTLKSKFNPENDYVMLDYRNLGSFNNNTDKLKYTCLDILRKIEGEQKKCDEIKEKYNALISYLSFGEYSETMLIMYKSKPKYKGQLIPGTIVSLDGDQYKLAWSFDPEDTKIEAYPKHKTQNKFTEKRVSVSIKDKTVQVIQESSDWEYYQVLFEGE